MEAAIAAGAIAPLLERRGFDDSHQQGGESPVVPLDPGDDLVHGFDVMIIEAAAQGIGEELLGEAAVEVAPEVVLEDLLQVADVLERLAREQLAGGVDRLLALGLAPHSQGIEVLERQPERVHPARDTSAQSALVR